MATIAQKVDELIRQRPGMTGSNYAGARHRRRPGTQTPRAGRLYQAGPVEEQPLLFLPDRGVETDYGSICLNAFARECAEARRAVDPPLHMAALNPAVDHSTR